MTITIKKLHLVIAILAVVLIAPTTALATHIFTDVPDEAFYADPVEWAFNNEITTGTSTTTFSPLDNVTRGESVTFLKRYDDNVVQPAVEDFDGRTAALETKVAALEALGAAGRLDALEAAAPFAVTAFQTGTTALTSTATAFVTVSVTAPVAGHVTLNTTSTVTHTTDDGDILCVIAEGDDIPNPGTFGESDQWFETSGPSDGGSVSGTRTFEIAAGATTDYVLACREATNGGSIRAGNITAIFTPAP